MKKFILFITAFAMLVGLINVSALAAPAKLLSADDTPPETPAFYGRSALGELSNSAALLYAYDAITAGVLNMDSSINVYDGTHRISQDELATVLDAYRRDRADHFWLGNHYTISYTPETVTSYNPSYIFEKSELPDKMDKFNAAIDGIIAAIPSAASEIEREVFIHDTLASRITYVLTAPNAHNAYGALVEGEAVCEGYAEALQVLLFRAGIQSFLILGKSNNPSGGTPEGHEWNIVRLGGQYYHVDLTWNDQDSLTYHAYMNVSDARITQDHTIDPTGFALPACTDESQNYFNVYGGAFTEYSAETIAERLKANGMMASFFLSDPNAAIDFKNFVGTNMSDIAHEADIVGSYSYSMSSLGCEVYLMFDGYCSHTGITHFEEVSASCDTSGQRAHYFCATCNRLYLDGDLSSPVSESELYISPLGHSYATSCAEVCTVCGATRTAPHALTKSEGGEDSHICSCECGANTLTEAHTDKNIDGKCDVCSHEVEIQTPLDTAKGYFGIFTDFFGRPSLDKESTVLLTSTLIMAGLSVVVLFILSRVFRV